MKLLTLLCLAVVLLVGCPTTTKEHRDIATNFVLDNKLCSSFIGRILVHDGDISVTEVRCNKTTYIVYCVKHLYESSCRIVYRH